MQNENREYLFGECGEIVTSRIAIVQKQLSILPSPQSQWNSATVPKLCLELRNKKSRFRETSMGVHLLLYFVQVNINFKIVSE